MTKVEERNNLIRSNLTDMYNVAISPNALCTAYDEILSNIVRAKERSYREILLCIISIMLIQPDLKATENWKSLHPRGLYDKGPIKEFLREHNIPHTKSGPLNISKATNINSEWAKGRDSSHIANNVVEVVSYLEAHNTPAEIKAIGISLIRMLLTEAVRVQNLSINIPPSLDPDYLSHACLCLIQNAPDAGNTPQQIAGMLLKNYHTSIHSNIKVTGGDDRASVTSTTSNKPGDINEELFGRILKVYEITVKPFNIDRIIDSYDCVCQFNQSTNDPVHEIIVICRPEDCPVQIENYGFNFYLGKYIYQDVVYYFWNIYEWVVSMLQRMPNCGKELFFTNLSGYISNINTSESVKLEWRRIHGIT